MILFFETYSIAQTLLLCKYIRRAEKVYFHKKAFPPQRHNPRYVRLTKKLIYFINKKSMIDLPKPEIVNALNWPINKRALHITEELAVKLQRTPSYTIISKIVKDENILKCFKAQLVEDASTRLLFFAVAKDMTEKMKGDIYLIPAENDNIIFEKELFGENGKIQNILHAAYFVNSVRGLVIKFFRLAMLLLLPLAYIMLNIKKMSFSKTKGKTYDLAMPIVWGFHEKSVMITGVQYPQEDSYLYDKNITPNRVIHIFNHWKFPPQIKKRYKEVMEKRGLAYADSEDYVVTRRFLREVMKIQFSIIGHTILNLGILRDRPDFLKYSTHIIFYMLKKYLELENVSFKVEFVKRDYSPSHIIETILCNKNNIRTIGIQHTASPYDLPQLSYAHFNDYIVYGDIFVKPFLPYWNGIKLSRIGKENIDWVVNIAKDKDRLEKIKERISYKYMARKYTILMLLPGGMGFTLKKQWEKLFEALSSLKNIDIDFNLFLRFRSKEFLSSPDHTKCFAQLPYNDKRIIIDLENFTTHELMAVSDLCIACNASFAIYEALACNIKVFTFDFMGTAKYYFPDCGKDFILYTKEDVLKIFKGLENDFSNFDCDWDKIKRGGSFYYDGRNLERIRSTVFRAMKEV